jgi:predicted dehydrogenase
VSFLWVLVWIIYHFSKSLKVDSGASGMSEHLPPVKLGFAGVGFMGQVAHLRNYVGRSDCQVVAIAEPRRELAQKVAAAFGIPRIYRNHRELAEDDEVQAVVASQPHLRNGHVGLPLLAAGKHLFVEKPMAGSLAEAEQMQAAADAAGVLIMVGLMKRYDTSVLAAQAELQGLYASGELGALQRIHAHCYGGDWTHDAVPPLRSEESVPDDPSFAPRYPAWMDVEQGKQFQNYMNIIAHNINLVRFLYGGALQVQAAVGRRQQRLMHTALLTGEDGVIVELSGGAVRSHQWEEETHFYFEQGFVKLYTPSPLNRQARGRVEIYRGDGGKRGQMTEIIPPIDWAFRRQAEQFVAAVQQGVEPPTSGRDGLQDMRLMEEVFRVMTLV